MSEPFVRTRPGPGGYGAPAQRPGSAAFGREDPLAELARLVGKDDPFREAPPKAVRPSNIAQFPQLAAPNAAPSYDEAGEHPYDANEERSYFDPDAADPDFDAQLRGSLDERHAAGARPRDALRFPALPAPAEHSEPMASHQFTSPAGHGEAPPLNADLWAEGVVPQGSSDPGSFDGPMEGEAVEGRSSKRTIIVLAAVLALTCGGLGATFLMHEGAGHAAGNGGAAPTIMADDGPVKVPSPDMNKDGGADSNTALLEKTGSDKVDNAKVVTNQEQPVDLGQLPKGTASQADASAAPGAAAPSPFPEPRKVKTILIRPDGSVVGETPAAQGALPQVPGGVVMPALADGSAPPQEAAAPPPAPVAKPSTPKSTARISSTPKTADASANGGASGAKQSAAPIRAPKAKPVVVADAGTPAETPAATPGTYAVQLAAPGTEQDAKDTAARLQKKFSGELGGLKPSIHKGESGSKSVYRVRVSNLSQDDAKSLCSKLQSSGGSCFVVRN